MALTLAEQIANAAAGQDTTENVSAAPGESLKTTSKSGL